MVYRSVEVEVDLSDFDTDELMEELQIRGYDYNAVGVDGDKARELLEKIWLKRRTNRDFEAELDSLIYYVLDKVV